MIEPEEVLRKTGYSRPHRALRSRGLYISTLGGAGADGTEGPPGVFLMDCESFEVLGKWEIERGPQKLHYDFWWNLPRDYMVSSEWGLPPQFEGGIVAEDLLANRYGHQLHFWDLRGRRHVQSIDLGANHQMALEVRPAHEPTREYGFVGVVVDTTNLEASIWTWWREGGKFQAKKTAVIPPEPADASLLPPLLKGFGAVPPLVSDIDLSLDDRFLYVACWGTGELRQYEVSDPMNPRLAGSVHVGGIARRTPHSERNGFRRRTADDRDQPRRQARLFHQLALQPLGRPVLSRRRRPGGRLMCHVGADGGLTLDPGFLVDFGNDYGAHQIRLQGGDCSTDSFAFRRPEARPRVAVSPLAAASLWAGVVAIGLYHGLNPAMGWPLAVANGLERQRGAAVFATWLAAGGGPPAGHGAGAAALRAAGEPAAWGREIRIGVGLLVLFFGAWRLVRPGRHRWSRRLRPTQLTLWSFLMASAHGAGLMLLPILVGLCGVPADPALDPPSTLALMRASAATAVAVSLVHSAAMIGSGLCVAWLVYRYLGLKALRSAWLDLDTLWSAGLMLSGAAAIATA